MEPNYDVNIVVNMHVYKNGDWVESKYNAHYKNFKEGDEGFAKVLSDMEAGRYDSVVKRLDEGKYAKTLDQREAKDEKTCNP